MKYVQKLRGTWVVRVAVPEELQLVTRGPAPALHLSALASCLARLRQDLSLTRSRFLDHRSEFMACISGFTTRKGSMFRERPVLGTLQRAEYVSNLLRRDTRLSQFEHNSATGVNRAFGIGFRSQLRVLAQMNNGPVKRAP